MAVRAQLSYVILALTPGGDMPLSEHIQKDLVTAMREKDELRLSVLRMVKSAIKYKEIEKGKALDDLEALQVLQTLVKHAANRWSSIFMAGGQTWRIKKPKKLP
jgi:hypothetical protein